MGERIKDREQEFSQLVDLCMNKAGAISRFMGNLEAALRDLNRWDSNEITLAAIQDVNDVLNTLISTWDQWAGRVSKEMDILGQLDQ